MTQGATSASTGTGIQASRRMTNLLNIAHSDLTECEGIGLNSGIEELDLERVLGHVPVWRINW